MSSPTLAQRLLHAFVFALDELPTGVVVTFRTRVDGVALTVRAERGFYAFEETLDLDQLAALARDGEALAAFARRYLRARGETFLDFVAPPAGPS